MIKTIKSIVMSFTPVEPIPAATVIPLKDTSHGLQVLLLKRHEQLSFGAGHWVFPGGRIDQHELERYSEPLMQARYAAVREAQEEANLQIANNTLHYYSHWVAPESFPKRFATWFFICEIDDQAIQVDGQEIVEYCWLSPTEAVEKINQGELTVMPPTYVSLVELSRYAKVAAAIEFAQQREAPYFLPKPHKLNDVLCMLYPGDVFYDKPDVDLLAESEPQHRLWIKADNQWQYINTAVNITQAG